MVIDSIAIIIIDTTMQKEKEKNVCTICTSCLPHASRFSPPTLKANSCETLDCLKRTPHSQSTPRSCGLEHLSSHFALAFLPQSDCQESNAPGVPRQEPGSSSPNRLSSAAWTTTSVKGMNHGEKRGLHVRAHSHNLCTCTRRASVQHTVK